LAIVVLYFAKLWQVLVGLPTRPAARAFAANVLLAFLPAALLGAVLHDFIKTVLFNPVLVCVALFVGGVAILLAEKFAPPARIADTESMGRRTALLVGIGQCLSMIPGVSRSGATILSALMLGVERKAAVEFSFFLSIPTMFGAVAYDLFKARHDLQASDVGLIAVGFVVAFVVALPVVKWLVGFVSRNGFAPFAYYRMAVGAIGLVLLLWL
jgi:undecaprenyl-diphosphatase